MVNIRFLIKKCFAENCFFFRKAIQTRQDEKSEEILVFRFIFYGSKNIMFAAHPNILPDAAPSHSFYRNSAANRSFN
jgi:hypothetical protein